MFSGDVNRRKTSGFGKNIQSCFRCYTGVNFGGNTNSPCMDSQRDTETFPKTPCPGGIRSSVLFPMCVFSFPVMDGSDRQKRDNPTNLAFSSCWDGKNLDSPNHMDHLAHPTDHPASFAVVGSTCPSTHPVKIPQVHYEVRDIGR